MRYIELKEQLKDFIVFSTSDIQKIDPFFHKQRLSEWQKKGYIKKIVNEFYIFSDLEINESALFVIANEIYNPSYISFEMALSYYDLIPETVYSITSASSRKTQNFETDIAAFSYRRIKPELMFGYALQKYKNHNFKIAEAEKAVLDFLYINPGIKTEGDFYELRINRDEFQQKINRKKMEEYLKLFENQSLKKRVNNFLEFMSHA